MLLPHETLQQAKFRFEYLYPGEHFMQLAGIGWDDIQQEEYLHYGREDHQPTRVVFQITLSGSGFFQIGGEKRKLAKNIGFMCLIPGDQLYYFTPDCGHWEFLFISIRGRDAVSHWINLIAKLGHVVDFSGHPVPLEILSQLYHDIYIDRSLDEYEVSGKLYLLMLEIYKAGKQIINPAIGIPDCIDKSIQYMEKHYVTHITLHDLAHISGYSVEHFSRLFRFYTGIPPMKYVRKVRLEKASLLLNNSTITLENIASSTGFASKSHLSKSFKVIVGITPGEYRNGRGNSVDQYLRIQH